MKTEKRDARGIRDFFRSFQGSLTSQPMNDAVSSHEPSNYVYYITSCLQFNVKNFVFYPKKEGKG